MNLRQQEPLQTLVVEHTSADFAHVFSTASLVPTGRVSMSSMFVHYIASFLLDDGTRLYLHKLKAHRSLHEAFCKNKLKVESHRNRTATMTMYTMTAKSILRNMMLSCCP
jgi:hypothetical protein